MEMWTPKAEQKSPHFPHGLSCIKSHPVKVQFNVKLGRTADLQKWQHLDTKLPFDQTSKKYRISKLLPNLQFADS